MCWPKGAECEGRAAFHRRSESRVTTILDKELKRRIAVDGVDYTVVKIGEGNPKAGMEKPVYYCDQVIAPSGATFYTADDYLGAIV